MKKDVQSKVQSLIDSLVEQDEERGLQVCAYYKGKLVVDAWSGVADPASGRKVDGETLFPVFSTTKGIAATAVNMLVERGKLDYDAPIAKYWPEFGCRGKERITLRHALAHTAALPQMPDSVTLDELCDWDAMCARIASMEPLWEPGTRGVYHAITYGWLVGEPARRVDGRGFGKIVEEELCKPLGIESLYIGIPSELNSLVAPLEPEKIRVKPGEPQAPPAPPDPIGERAIPPYVKPLERWIGEPKVRQACFPASNGIATARAIARHYAALIDGSLDGVRILSKKTIEAMRALNTPPEATDFRRSLGYALYGPANDPGRIFGHGGYGGSLGMADLKAELAIGIAKNRMVNRPSPDTAQSLIVREIRSALDILA